MTQTVIGIFDYTSEAQAAAEYLEKNGFSRANIDISARAADDNDMDRDDDRDHGFGEGISNFFSSLFSDNDEADRYSEVGRHGSIVTVHVASGEEAERAARILDEYGAIDVDDRSRQYRENRTGMGTAGAAGAVSSDRPVAERDINDTSNRSIPVIEEHLEVGKKVVETGSTRLRSRIVERPVEENVRLRTERIRVERTPVNRPATEADLNRFRDTTIEATEHKEIPVVDKQAHIVEEVSLNKDVEHREEKVKDTLRRTEVDIDKSDSDQDLRNRAANTDESLRNRMNNSASTDDDDLI